MPRILGAKAANELRIHDNISGDEIILFHRMPTTAEREGYANESIKRHRNKTTFSIVAAREKYGSKILTGFREGDFQVEGADGKLVAFASDPASPNYREDWKDLMVQHASDLIQALAGHVFDAPAEVMDGGADDAEKN